MGEVRKELHRIRRALQEQEPQRPKDGDNQLYAALDRLMREQERFRDPNLTREQVAAELGTNKPSEFRRVASSYKTHPC